MKRNVGVPAVALNHRYFDSRAFQCLEVGFGNAFVGNDMLQRAELHNEGEATLAELA